jgi:metal-responsive CopG/Arc/MetJ family transcriptional regulator
MRKLSFSMPEELVEEIDRERGEKSRNRFVGELIERALRDHQEREYRRITTEVYADASFAEEEERISEGFLDVAPEADL